MEDTRPWFEGKANLSYNSQIDKWLSAVDKLSKSIEELRLAKEKFEKKVSKLKSKKSKPLRLSDKDKQVEKDAAKEVGPAEEKNPKIKASERSGKKTEKKASKKKEDETQE